MAREGSVSEYVHVEYMWDCVSHLDLVYLSSLFVCVGGASVRVRVCPRQ